MRNYPIRINLNKIMYECNICNRKFKSLRSLTFHLSTVHKINIKHYKQSEEYKHNLKIELLRLSEHDDDCIIWNGYVFSDGYGGYESKRVHRLSYELFKGKLDQNKLVCHTCDNPRCINPEHLYLGSNQDNMNDMKERKRSLKGNLNPATREDVKAKLRKTWIVTLPTNEDIEVSNLMKFCDDYNLKYRSMTENGKYRGYLCQRK